MTTTTAEDTQAVLAIIQRLHSELGELRETRLRLIDELVFRALKSQGFSPTVPGLVLEGDVRLALYRIEGF